MKKLVSKVQTIYNNMLLQSKLLATYLIIISIPMFLVASFLYGKVYDMVVADTIRKQQEETSKTAPYIDDKINQLLGDYTKIEEHPFVSKIFTALKADASISALCHSRYADAFCRHVETIMEDGFIENVRFYVELPDKDLALINPSFENMIVPLSSLNNTYWRGIFSGTNISELHCPAFYLSKNEVEKLGDMAYITKHRVTSGTKTYICYLAIYYSSDVYLDILQQTLPTEGSVSYLINDRDSIIATTSPALSSTYYLNYNTIQDAFMSSNNFLEKIVLGETIYAGMYNIRAPQWYMVVVIPSTPLIWESRNIMSIYFLIFGGTVLLALLLAVLVSRSITKRISMVTKQMARVRTGPPTPLAVSIEHDEIGDLIDTYNYMCVEMNNLMEERARSAEELRISEFKSLQAQINPHFLYNTMDMINWMAADGRTSEIGNVVQNLSRFYKLTLSKKTTLSTIEDEIEHISIYIRLLNMRFHNTIDLVIDIPDELLEYEIPKLTLQPVVENAILHGIMEKDEKRGCVVLTGWINNENIELMVSDNGVGISAEKLVTILDGTGNSKTGNNIAIYNTHHRLQILYGEKYGLSYSSQLGIGTDVCIQLPAKKAVQ